MAQRKDVFGLESVAMHRSRVGRPSTTWKTSVFAFFTMFIWPPTALMSTVLGGARVTNFAVFE